LIAIVETGQGKRDILQFQDYVEYSAHRALLQFENNSEPLQCGLSFEELVLLEIKLRDYLAFFEEFG